MKTFITINLSDILCVSMLCYLIIYLAKNYLKKI